MEKGLDQDLLSKIKAVAQGPEADLLREFVDLLYYRREEADTGPLSPEEQAALEEGREALRRGDRMMRLFTFFLSNHEGKPIGDIDYRLNGHSQ